MSDVMGEKKR